MLMNRIARVVPAALVMFCVVLTPAQAQPWVEFVDQTAERLVAAGDVGANDDQERMYAWADLNNNGWVDLVAMRKQPGITTGRRRNVLFMNESGVLVDRSQEYASASTVPGDQGFLTPTLDTDCAIGDVDLDGWRDIVTAVAHGDGMPKHISHPRVYRNLGTASGNWQGFLHEDDRIPVLACCNGGVPHAPRFNAVSAGDVTGDGFLDLYFGDMDLGGPQTLDFNDRLLVNDGAGFFADESFRIPPAWLNSTAVTSAIIADMNGNGVNDIVRNDAGAAAAQAFYNDASNPGFFVSLQTIVTTAPASAAVGDLNNTGRLDIVVSRDGLDVVRYNLGTAPNGQVQWSGLQVLPDSGGVRSDVTLADLNGSGWPDIVIANLSYANPACGGHFARMYRNNAEGPQPTFTMSHGNLSPAVFQNSFFVCAFDLTGNGANDLVVARGCAGTGGTVVLINQDDGPPTGACCFFMVDACIEGLTQSQCNAEGGVFLGAGTTCDQCQAVVVHHQSADLAPMFSHVTFGGGTSKETPIAVGGRWTFDELSLEQQTDEIDCERFTAENPGGELPPTIGMWFPTSNQVHLLYVPEMVPTQETANVKGWAIGFGLPGEIFEPGELHGIESPVIPLEALGITPGTYMTLRFASSAPVLPPSLVYVLGMRYFVDGVPLEWEEVVLPILPGPRQYSCVFETPVLAEADGVQFSAGAQNESRDPVPVPPEGGPVIDEADAANQDPEPDPEQPKEWKLVPSIKQTDREPCQVSAFTSCLSWWAKNGYPELVEGETDKEKHDNLQSELGERMFPQNAKRNPGNAGVPRYLREKGVYHGQKQPKGRDPLRHAIIRNPTNEQLKEWCAAQADVIVNVLWHDHNGDVIPGGGHAMTLTRCMEDEDGKKSIYVANSWGESVHSVTNETASTVYEKLEVTIPAEGGCLQLFNNHILNDAAGVQPPPGAPDRKKPKYLCLDAIDVIRPVPPGFADDPAEVRLVEVQPHPSIPGAITFTYEVLNLPAEAFSFVGLSIHDDEIDVLSWDASSPQWTGEALPVLYPGAEHCGQFLGGEGVAFTRDGDPILEWTFSIHVAGPVQIGESAIAFVHGEDGVGWFILADGPVPGSDCPIPADLNCDGHVDVQDLLVLLSAWGVCADCDDCPADINDDCAVDVQDLLILLANWG